MQAEREGDRLRAVTRLVVGWTALRSSSALYSSSHSPSQSPERAAMATSNDLHAAFAAKHCVVHPLVLLSIQDHFHRVAKNTRKRVLGILLGQDLGPKGYNISNSFAVPFEEDERDPRTWFLDHNYVEAMNDMFKKVNGACSPLNPQSGTRTLTRERPPGAAREKLIGWYHTGPKLRASDLEINEVVKRYHPRPVMVIVDVRPDHEREAASLASAAPSSGAASTSGGGGGGAGGIPTDAYFAVEEIKDVSLRAQHDLSASLLTPNPGPPARAP